MGGEKNKELEGVWLPMGSPPHGRGKVMKANKKVKENGITPAWAGKRGWMRATEITRKDHPRVGGEKVIQLEREKRQLGSPPHGRGKGPFEADLCGVEGITPACAGKRSLGLRRRTAAQDHPRVGGEKKVLMARARCSRGSPPHGRGKARIAHQESQCQRITPA